MWTAAQAGKLDGLQDLECNELACQAVFTDIAAFNQALSETNSAFEEYEGRISAAGGIQVGRFESAETVTETKTPTPTPTPESAPTDTSVQPSISVRVEYLADTDGSVEINLLELNGAESVPFEINVSAAGSTVRGSLSAEGDQAVASGLEAGDTITITYDGQTYSKFTYPEV